MTGDSYHICQGHKHKPENLQYFVMDCAEGGNVTCKCCDTCCDSSVTACNKNDTLLANFESSNSKDRYRRDQYVFSEDLVFSGDDN
jgi:hypothetical protein